MRLGLSLKLSRHQRLNKARLRVAEVQARMMHDIYTMVNSNDTFLMRMPFVIGQDMKSILLSFMNWYQLATGEFSPGNAITVQSCSIESSSGTVVPVRFNGNRSKVINDGDNDIQSDLIFPSAFGLSKFSRGEQYWFKMILSVPTGGKMPRTARLVSAFSGSQVAWYQSSLTTPSSTDISGQYTTTGTSPINQPNGYQPIILGYPVIDGPSFITIGDSIGEGTGDTTAANLYGHGFIQRAMGNGGVNPYPSLNFCRGSMTSDHAITATKWRAYIKYARYAIEEYGTNDIVISTKTVSEIQSSLTNLWTILKNGGAEKILRTNLMCFTTSTDNWLTAANQTIRAGWGVGEKTDQLNTWFPTKVTDGTLHSVISFSEMLDNVTPNKWLTNGVAANYMTTDGVHPSPTGHSLAAQSLRSTITTLS